MKKKPYQYPLITAWAVILHCSINGESHIGWLVSVHGIKIGLIIIVQGVCEKFRYFKFYWHNNGAIYLCLISYRKLCTILCKIFCDFFLNIIQRLFWSYQRMVSMVFLWKHAKFFVFSNLVTWSRTRMDKYKITSLERERGVYDWFSKFWDIGWLDLSWHIFASNILSQEQEVLLRWNLDGWMW